MVRFTGGQEMKKIFLAMISGLLMLTGCMTVKDLSSDPKYKEIINKEYQTQADFAVFTFQDNKKEYVLDKFGTQDIPELSKIDKFPFHYYGNTIYGILPKGTHFNVIKIRFEKTFESSHVFYMAKILDGPFKGYDINVTFLTDSGGIRRFLPENAVPVDKPQQ